MATTELEKDGIKISVPQFGWAFNPIIADCINPNNVKINAVLGEIVELEGDYYTLTSTDASTGYPSFRYGYYDHDVNFISDINYRTYFINVSLSKGLKMKYVGLVDRDLLFVTHKNTVWNTIKLSASTSNPITSYDLTLPEGTTMVTVTTRDTVPFTLYIGTFESTQVISNLSVQVSRIGYNGKTQFDLSGLSRMLFNRDEFYKVEKVDNVLYKNLRVSFSYDYTNIVNNITSKIIIGSTNIAIIWGGLQIGETFNQNRTYRYFKGYPFTIPLYLEEKAILERVSLGEIIGTRINYSFEEQDTGLKWDNGSSIYQRTFAFANIQKQDNSVSIASLTLTRILNYSGTISTIGGANYPLPNVHASNVNNGISLSASTSALYLYLGSGVIDQLLGGTAYVTIRYTKGEVLNPGKYNFDITGILDKTLQRQRILIGTNITINIEVSDCNLGDNYLRWINTRGEWNYYLFKKTSEAIESEASDIVFEQSYDTVNYVNNHHAGTGQYISKSGIRTLNVAAVNLDQNMYDFVRGITLSPIVDLYDNGNWKRVKIGDSDLTKSGRVLQNLEIGVILSDLITQSL